MSKYQKMKDAAEADLLMIKTTREVALQTAIQTGDLNTARYLKGDTFTKQDAEANYTAMKLRERTDKLNEQSLTESLINEIMGKDKSLNRQEAYQKIQDLSSGQKNAIKNILPSITGEEFQLALDENLQNLAQNKAPITRDQMQKIVNNVIRRYKVASMKTQGFGSPFTSFEEGEEDYKYQTPYKIINPNFDEEGEEDEETVAEERPRKYITSGFDIEDVGEEEEGEETVAKPSVKQDIRFQKSDVDIIRYKSFIDTMRNSPFAKRTPELKPLLSEDASKDDPSIRLMRLEGIQAIMQEPKNKLPAVVMDRIKAEIKRAQEAEENKEKQIISQSRPQKKPKSFEPVSQLDITDMSKEEQKEYADLLEFHFEEAAKINNINIQPIKHTVETIHHKKGSVSERVLSKSDKQTILNQMASDMNLPKDELSTAIYQLHLTKLSKALGIYLPSQSESSSVAAAKPTKKASKIGRGLTKLPFGKYLIDHKKLKKNILSVSYPNGQKVSGIPNVKVSDNLKKVFMNKQVNTKVVKLDDVEKLLIHKLLNRSDATVSKSKQKLVGNVDMMNVKDLKARMNILLGEIDAGNDSPQIKKELKELLEKGVLLGEITKKQAKMFLAEF